MIKNFLNNLMAIFARWLFEPTPKQTYPCCGDADKDEEEQ